MEDTEPRLNKYGVEIGKQVPLHIANKITRERDSRSRDLTKEVQDIASAAIKTAMSSEEKPRRGRPRKNLRAPVESPKAEE